MRTKKVEVMPSHSTQQAIIEVSKIIGTQFTVSAASLLLNEYFKISPVPVEAAVMIGLLSIPMGLSVVTLFTALTGQSIFHVAISHQHSPANNELLPAHRIAQ